MLRFRGAIVGEQLTPDRDVIGEDLECFEVVRGQRLFFGGVVLVGALLAEVPASSLSLLVNERGGARATSAKPVNPEVGARCDSAGTSH